MHKWWRESILWLSELLLLLFGKHRWFYSSQKKERLSTAISWQYFVHSCKLGKRAQPEIVSAFRRKILEGDDWAVPLVMRRRKSLLPIIGRSGLFIQEFWWWLACTSVAEWLCGDSVAKIFNRTNSSISEDALRKWWALIVHLISPSLFSTKFGLAIEN